MSVVPDPARAHRVAVIAALDFEKASLQALLESAAAPSTEVSLIQAGVGLQKASSAARSALDNGASGLVSWGVAGGLDPGLAPGTVLLPPVVHTSTGERLPTDDRWRDNLRRVLGADLTVHEGALLSVDKPLLTPRDKARAAADSGAAAVDMESAAVGRAALASGRPFVVVRVILDKAGDRLPDIAGLIDQTGNRDRRAMVRIACRPTEWPRFLVLARRFRRARSALARCATHTALDVFHYPELSSARG